jgi:DNA (cytosine-5)-methyltransferase 1
MNYHNEIDKYAAQWIRNLIAAGHIAPGEVDVRSISDVKPSELVGYTQCHFFAGIGGWSLALRLAGWPDDRPVWTGSCPCQPFSVAGQGAGTADERHLWPHWFHLIRALKPPTVFGEQVDAAINHGWLDLVQDDLEGEGYAFGAVGVPAAGVGAPHIRQRLWFVADDQRFGREVAIQHTGDGRSATGERETDVCGIGGTPGWLANNNNNPRLEGWESVRQRGVELVAREDGVDVIVADADGGNTGAEREQRSGEQRLLAQSGGFGESFWSRADWLPCRDGKWRPVEPGTFPLAHGVSNRVGRLRAYGNAIVPQVAEQVIRAYMECRPC